MEIQNLNIVVVGLGLIGGSLLKGLRLLRPKSLKGIDISEDVLEKCRKLKLIDNEEESLSEIISNGDIIFLCLYPNNAVNFLEKYMDVFKRQSLITDVIGLKSDFCETISNILREDLNFIGGHPMAGKEGSGFELSSNLIFKDSNYLLAFKDLNEDKYLDVLIEIIYGLGCRHVEILSPIEHDEIITYTSHMPHILSSTFMNCNNFSKTKNCIAGSFKDFVRIADINASLWTELIMNNRELVLKEINKFKDKLTDLESSISNNNSDFVFEFLEEAKFKKKEITK